MSPTSPVPDYMVYNAANKGRLSALRKLLDEGGDKDAHIGFGFTPLIAAASSGCTACVAELLSRNAELETHDITGGTALLAAAKKCHAEIFRMLLEAGASVWVRDAKGKTILDYCMLPKARKCRLDVFLAGRLQRLRAAELRRRVRRGLLRMHRCARGTAAPVVIVQPDGKLAMLTGPLRPWPAEDVSAAQPTPEQLHEHQQRVQHHAWSQAIGAFMMGGR